MKPMRHNLSQPTFCAMILILTCSLHSTKQVNKGSLKVELNVCTICTNNYSKIIPK